MPQLKTLAEANNYLSRFYDNRWAIYTLDNMQTLMKFLDNPQEKFKSVHIAGTSGKTSTAYYMSALLTAAGLKTGLTISPHIDSLTERVQINGQPLSEAEFCRALSEYTSLIETVPVKPSWFELMVSFAYWYFAEEKVDYAVIEVGLGGLLDGTNVINRPDKLCLIADIGLDHTDILGNNLAEIAAQKIGIVQPHNVVLTHSQAPEIMKVFEDWCRERDAELRVITESKNADPAGYQNRNWQLAYSGFEELSNRDSLQHLTSQVLDTLQQMTIPGRMDVRQVQNKTVIMDGAHNTQKIAAFLKSFKQKYPATRPAILLALKEGKDYREIVSLIAPTTDNLIITSFQANQDTPINSMDPRELAQAFEQAGNHATVISDANQAFKQLLAAPEQVVIVIGSFYFLSQIRNNKPND